MGRPSLEMMEDNARAVQLFKELGDKSNYPLSYVMWFVKEWDDAVAKLRRG